MSSAIFSGPEFADWLAICSLKARYCRCLDTEDWVGYADCFTEDLTLDTSPAGGARVEGREAVADCRVSAHKVECGNDR
jgi:SnoaL-like domain